MAQITTIAVNSATGWTRLDSLASHTYIEVHNEHASAGLGIRISGTDPGAGTAWNASGSRVVQPGDAWPMRLGTSDQVWGRLESGTGNAAVSEAT